jgi:hypothetical protein
MIETICEATFSGLDPKISSSNVPVFPLSGIGNDVRRPKLLAPSCRTARLARRRPRQESTELLCRFAIRLCDKVGIDAERRGRVGMSQSAAHGSHRDTRRKTGNERCSKCVE